ncbi:MAG: suppressor of fused domain protein [Defluviitaleaceae bacterium]|nr:suppressor of fused domain protein [Defluviitaleaceae bacterium]
MNGFGDAIKKILDAIKRLFGGSGKVNRKPVPVETIEEKRGNSWNRKKILKHFETYFGASGEVIDTGGNVLIHIVSPTPERNYYTLFTSGMSETPMATPSELKGYEYAELMLHLPASWVFNPKDPKTYWPVEWLKTLAYLPLDENTWLFYGHTIPNGDNAAPFAENTGFGCFIVGTTNLLEDEESRNAFSMLDIGDDKVVYCFTLFPIYKAEMDYKLQNTAQDLFALFSLHGVGDVIDIYRDSLV